MQVIQENKGLFSICGKTEVTKLSLLKGNEPRPNPNPSTSKQSNLPQRKRKDVKVGCILLMNINMFILTKHSKFSKCQSREIHDFDGYSTRMFINVSRLVFPVVILRGAIAICNFDFTLINKDSDVSNKLRD